MIRFGMDEIDATPSVEKGKNGREIFTQELADEIISACGSGFTLEKAGVLVGVNANTIKTWASRKPDFARKVETARKRHELSLLRDIERAGEKSWQAKAWCAERVYGYAQPSARLAVTQDVTHGISSNLASLLAGIAVKKKEKKAEVVDLPTLTKPQTQLHSTPTTSTHKSQNEYCINKLTLISNDLQKTSINIPKSKHKRMRLRKPRQSRPATTTPPATPPAPAWYT